MVKYKSFFNLTAIECFFYGNKNTRVFLQPESLSLRFKQNGKRNVTR